MNGQSIPGFYFDTEKKKYFKIQSAAASRDLDLKYSAENIRKKERRERFHNVAAARTSKVRKERVVCRYASNLTQTCADRELGIKRPSFYMHHLWPEACMFGVSSKPKKVVEMSSEAPIRCFDRDPVSKTVYAVQGDNRVKRRRQYSRDGPPLPADDPDTDEYFDTLQLNPYTFEPWDELARMNSTVSSMCYMPTTGALAVTTYGSDRPPVVQLSDPERDGPHISQQFTPKDCSAIWASAARPTHFTPSPGLTNSIAASHAEHLAVAASSSMLIFTRSQTGAWQSSVAVKPSSSDILALDWISYTTVALGSRNGKIRLYDTRSRGSSHVLTHPAPISKLKRADEQSRIVCSGLQDTLYLYDIRAPRSSCHNASADRTASHYNSAYFTALNPTGIHVNKKRRKALHHASTTWSQPLLTFPHANTDDLELDIDVHSRLGLVASAQDSESDVAIRVSNLWTGKTVREFQRSGSGDGRGVAQGGGGSGGGGSARKGRDVERIRTLKFMDDGGEDGGVDLWTTWDGGIARFAW